MDKNRIEGRHGAKSGHNTTKSSGMPVEVNAAAVQQSNVPLPGEISPSQDDEKSAEVIVVGEMSRSANEHSKVAGWSHSMKDRTNEEGIDPVTDAPADNAGRRGMDESCDGGKHGDPQVRTMIEEILDPEITDIAWKKVRSNKGAPGIDGMTVDEFPAFWQEHWPRISKAIMEGTYRPAPVKRAWIILPAGRSAMSLRVKGYVLRTWQSEARRDKASHRHTDGAGSSDSAKHRISNGADLRGRLQRTQLRLPTRSIRPNGGRRNGSRLDGRSPPSGGM